MSIVEILSYICAQMIKVFFRQKTPVKVGKLGIRNVSKYKQDCSYQGEPLIVPTAF